MPNPFDQSAYQVRFEWGAAGLARLAPADIVVVVDVLRFSSTVTDAVDAGGSAALTDALEWSPNGAAVAHAAASSPEPPVVLLGCLRNAGAVAAAVLELQSRRQMRTSVSVIAAGERAGDDLRVAVEDQLGAGAVIAALSALGLDHTSPEAAAAGEAAHGLRRALRHLIGASGSGRELTAGVGGVRATERMAAAGIVPTSVAQAAALDAVKSVPVLAGGVFTRFV